MPRTISTLPPTGRSFPAPPSSSPSSPSTTSATGSETRSTRARSWDTNEPRGAVLHAGHQARVALRPQRRLTAGGHAGRPRADRAAEPEAQRVLHGGRRAGAGGGEEGDRAGPASKPSPRAAPRRAGVDQGPHADPGNPDD